MPKTMPAIAAALAVLATAAPATAADWPMFHADKRHRGVSPETGLSAGVAGDLTQRWQANTGAEVFGSPVVARDDRRGAKLVYVGNQAGTMSAYRADTGARVWALDLDAPIASTPTVVDGVLYFGAHDHHVYALDASTGRLECRFRTGGVSTASPVAARPGGGGLVLYIGDNGLSGSDDGGRLWAVNGVDPNAAADCSARWSYDGWGAPAGSQPLAGVWTPPAYAVDRTGRPLVVFGSSSPDNGVYALDARTGERVWRFAPAGLFRDQDFGAGPTIGAPGVNGFADGVVYAAGKNRVLYALNLRTGARFWATDMDDIAPDAGGATRSTPALVNRRLLFGYGAGLVAVDAVTGAPLWTTAEHGVAMPEVISSPAVVGPSGDRLAFVQDTGGRLRAVAVESGRQPWLAPLGGVGYSSPAIAAGRVYVGAGNGFLYAFDAGGGTASAPPTTAIARPADGADVPNPDGPFALAGAASDDGGVRRVLVAVKDINGNRWWSPAAGAWVDVFAQWRATLAAPGARTTGWTARFPMPFQGGPFFAQAEAVDGDRQHDPTVSTASFFVPSLGHPADTAVTAPVARERFTFGQNPDGSVRRESFPIRVTGTARDSGGDRPGIAAVRVEIRNREHDEYWCGRAGCPGAPAGTLWQPEPITVSAPLAAAGASATAWSVTFLTYDHPHTYAVRAWALDRDGEPDTSPATVGLFCVRDPDDPSCHG